MTDKKIIPFSPPDISENEVQGVVEALKSGWITTGPKTKEFEKKIAEFCGTSKAVCLNSATACEESILRFLGIGEGDEVITSAYTYTASASPVIHVGAKVVLVDVAKDSYEMDYDKLEQAITERTKAIVPVDLGGIICDYERIFEIVERKKALFQPENEIQKAIGRIVVVADAAHAFGARMNIQEEWKRCGSVADFTSFSFHAVKNLTTAEGGALTWKEIPGIDNEWIYKQFMLLSLHGQSKDALAKTKLGAWEYDILAPSYKCNMTDIMAAIGLAQLERYEGLLNRRRKIIETYDKAFEPLGIQTLNHYGKEHVSTGHLYLTRIPGIGREEANHIIEKMAEEGIATNADCTFSLYLPNREDFHSRVKHEFPVVAISLSDYNAIREMLGYKTVTLEENEFTTQWHMAVTTDEQEEFIRSHAIVDTEAGRLTLSEQASHQEAMGETLYNSYTQVVYVFPDNICQNLLSVNRNRYIQTSGELSYSDAAALENKFIKAYPELSENGVGYYIRLSTLQVNEAKGMNFILKTAMIYGAVVLMVICLTILSLQQLLDAGQYRYRFGVLRKLGVEEQDIKSLVRKQLSVWFGLPVVVSIIVSAIVVEYFLQSVSVEISAYIGIEALITQVSITISILILLLLCYFLSTWILFRRSITE